MRRLAYPILTSAIILLGGTSVKADWDNWGFAGVYDIPGTSDVNLKIYTIDSSTGTKTLRSSTDIGNKGYISSFGMGNSYIDGNKIYVETTPDAGTSYHTKYGSKYFNIYDLDTDTWSADTDTSHWSDGLQDTQKRTGVFQYGDTTMEITSEGISKNGNNLIKKTSNGELHIGENSWITKEEDGRQKVYAKDAAGNPIPIDYTNGTKLLINGRDVEQSINNVGALSAALTGLPTVPTDTTLACGLGTGTHGGDFAFSGGCASKFNDKLSINYAASMTMPGQDYAGDFEDQLSARAGFVWKLGKSVKPTLMSMNEKKGMQSKITELSTANNELQAKVNSFESKNQELRNLLAMQNERLEKIEQTALANKNDEKTAFSFLNVSNLFSSVRSFLISNI